MKRFWQRAEAVIEGEGWHVRLDGKAVRVPSGAPLILETAALAEAVAAEWQDAGAVGGEVRVADLGLTRIAGTAQERIAPDPAPVAREIARYGETDLICYRADHPEALVLRERDAWDPWIAWALTRHGAALRTTAGIRHVEQESAALARLAAAVHALPAAALAALGVAVPLLGSLVLGLAMADGALDAAAAHGISAVDELFQAELWGQDNEAVGRRAKVRAEVLVAGRFLDLSRV